MKTLQFKNELVDLKNELEETAYLLSRGAATTASYAHSEELEDERLTILVELDEINYYINKDLNYDLIEEMDENVYLKQTKDLIKKYMIEYKESKAA